MKTVLWALIVIAVLIGAFFAFNSYIYNEKQADSADSLNPVPVTHTFEWIVEPSERFEETMPWQNVALVFDGSVFPVGEGLGCEGRSQRTDEENEVTHKSCWFGGGGEDFSVFLENGQYVVKKRWTQESGGPEVSAEPHGPWEVLFTLP